MYIWKITPLIEQLKSNELSQYEQMKYMIAYGLLMTISMDPFITIGLEYTYIDGINLLAGILISVGGTMYCYQVNKSTDDKDFILRLMTIGLPITVRLIVVMIIFGALVGIVEGMLGTDDIADTVTYKTSGYEVMILSIVGIFYYLYFGHKLKSFSREYV